MYICVCKAVSESRLRRAVATGAVMTLRDLTRELGVGTGCGKCLPMASAVLSSALAEQVDPMIAAGPVPACLTRSAVAAA